MSSYLDVLLEEYKRTRKLPKQPSEEGDFWQQVTAATQGQQKAHVADTQRWEPAPQERSSWSKIVGAFSGEPPAYLEDPVYKRLQAGIPQPLKDVGRGVQEFPPLKALERTGEIPGVDVLFGAGLGMVKKAAGLGKVTQKAWDAIDASTKATLGKSLGLPPTVATKTFAQLTKAEKQSFSAAHIFGGQPATAAKAPVPAQGSAEEMQAIEKTMGYFRGTPLEARLAAIRKQVAQGRAERFAAKGDFQNALVEAGHTEVEAGKISDALLKGEFDKTIPPLKGIITEAELEAMQRIVRTKELPGVKYPGTVRKGAQDALNKAFDGRGVKPSEIKRLEQILGADAPVVRMIQDLEAVGKAVKKSSLQYVGRYAPTEVTPRVTEPLLQERLIPSKSEEIAKGVFQAEPTGTLPLRLQGQQAAMEAAPLPPREPGVAKTPAQLAQETLELKLHLSEQRVGKPTGGEFVPRPQEPALQQPRVPLVPEPAPPARISAAETPEQLAARIRSAATLEAETTFSATKSSLDAQLAAGQLAEKDYAYRLAQAKAKVAPYLDPLKDPKKLQQESLELAAKARVTANNMYNEVKVVLDNAFLKGELDSAEYATKIATAERARDVFVQTKVSEYAEKLHPLGKTLVSHVAQEAGMTLVDAANLLRASFTGLDISIYRQLAWLTVTRPTADLKGLRGALRVIAEERKALKYLGFKDNAEATRQWRELEKKEWWPYYLRAENNGYDFFRPPEIALKEARERGIVRHGAEEFAFVTQTGRPLQRVGAKIPHVRASQDTFVSGANSFLSDPYEKGYKLGQRINEQIAQGKIKPIPDDVFHKVKAYVTAQVDPLTFDLDTWMTVDMPKYLSWMSGRGLSPGAGMAAEVASGFFFSLRLATGRLLSPTLLLDSNPLIRKMAWKDFSATIAFFSSIIYGGKQAGWWETGSLDRRDATFGKLRIGNTWLDPWGGMLRYLRFFSRLAENTTVSAVTGEVRELSTGSIVNELRTLAAPAIGILLDAYTGENFLGEPVDLKNPKQYFNWLAPLIIQDFKETFDDSETIGLLKAAPAILGTGVTTFPTWGYSGKELNKEISTMRIAQSKLNKMIQEEGATQGQIDAFILQHPKAQFYARTDRNGKPAFVEVGFKQFPEYRSATVEKYGKKLLDMDKQWTRMEQLRKGEVDEKALGGMDAKSKLAVMEAAAESTMNDAWISFIAEMSKYEK